MSHLDPYDMFPIAERSSFTQKAQGVRADKRANIWVLFWVFVFLPHHAACVILQFLTRHCISGLDRAQSPNQ